MRSFWNWPAPTLQNRQSTLRLAEFDPEETFAVSVAMRQISERSGRTTKRLSENCSARTAVGARSDERPV